MTTTAAFVTNPTSLHFDALQKLRGRARGALHRKAPLFRPLAAPGRLYRRGADGLRGRAHALVRRDAGAQSGARRPAALLSAGHLLVVPARLAPRRRLPHGLLGAPRAGRRASPSTSSTSGITSSTCSACRSKRTTCAARTASWRSTPTTFPSTSRAGRTCSARCISTTSGARTGAASNCSARTAPSRPTSARARSRWPTARCKIMRSRSTSAMCARCAISSACSTAAAPARTRRRRR